jgi:hypothetical protein
MGVIDSFFIAVTLSNVGKTSVSSLTGMYSAPNFLVLDLIQPALRRSSFSGAQRGRGVQWKGARQFGLTLSSRMGQNSYTENENIVHTTHASFSNSSTRSSFFSFFSWTHVSISSASIEVGYEVRTMYLSSLFLFLLDAFD